MNNDFDKIQKKVLLSLWEGKRLSVQSAMRDLHTTELRVIISRLRRQGFRIADEWKTTTDGRRYKEYFLNA